MSPVAVAGQLPACFQVRVPFHTCTQAQGWSAAAARRRFYVTLAGGLKVRQNSWLVAPLSSKRGAKPHSCWPVHPLQVCCQGATADFSCIAAFNSSTSDQAACSACSSRASSTHLLSRSSSRLQLRH